jgi:hypothetical protein
MVVFNKQGDLMFYQEQDEKTKKYKLMINNIRSN